jgi:transposase
LFIYRIPYSLDFNSIENFWNEMKIAIKKATVEFEESLDNIINSAIDSVPFENILAYFRHTGYLSF